MNNSARSGVSGCVPALCLFLLAAASACGVYSVPDNNGGGGGGGGDQFGPFEFLLPAEGAVVKEKFTVEVRGSTGVSRVGIRAGSSDNVWINSPPYVLEVDPLLYKPGPLLIQIVVDSFSSKHEDKNVELMVERPRPPLADMLAAIQSLAPGEWHEIPWSQCCDVEWVAPSAAEYLGSTDAIFEAAGGGVIDTKRNRFVIFGGGSGDFRNEIYVFDFGTLRWSRLNDPSPWPGGFQGGNVDDLLFHPADNAPVARKAWEHIAYLPDPVDRFVVLGGVVEGSEGRGELIDDPHIYRFDFDTKTWTVAAEEYPYSSNGAHAAVDKNGIIWIHGSESTARSRLLRYDPVTGAMEAEAQWPQGTYAFGRSCAIDHSRNLYVAIGNGSMDVWDLSDPQAAPVTWTTTGDREIEDAYGPGFIYQEASDRFVAWSGGKNVYTFDVATKVWTKHAATNSVDPGPARGRGTFGKFQYVPQLDRFFLANWATENVFVYRLPD